MGRRRHHNTKKAGIAGLALAALFLLCGATQASAEISFCPPGQGAGQCGAPLGIGAQRGLAADTESGRLYVADEANNRIDVFEVDAPGEAMKFLFAFGWGVADGTTNALQSCTTTCFKGIAGEGAGQFNRPAAVAVDNDPASSSQHAIYVADSANLRLQKFDPTGEFIWTVGKGVDKTDGGDLCAKAEGHACGRGASSSAEGGFASADLIALGPGGVIYAVDNIRLPGDVYRQRLQRFEPSGALIPSQVTLFEGFAAVARAITVEAGDDFWVTTQGHGLSKYSPDGTLVIGPIESAANFGSGLAIDAAGDLYAAQSEGSDKGSSGYNVLTAYDPTGNVFRRFAYTPSGGGGFGNSLNGLAAHTSAFGDVFFSQSSGPITYVSEPPPGPVAAPPSLKATNIGAVKATAVAEVNPEGKATQVHFEYLSQQAYVEQGESFAGPATKSTPTVPLGAEGFNLKATEALLGCPNPTTEASEPGKCLLPETTYRFRVVATNPDGAGAGTMEGTPFETKRSLEFGELYATAVDTDTARLNAEANPQGLPTTAYFEYVDDAAYQADIEAGGDGFAAATKAPAVDKGQAPLDFGAGEGFATRSISISPLTPGTTYHYRLLADNPLIEPVASEEVDQLTTFAPPASELCPNEASRIGPGALLPDCRAYEMVSPLDKAGGDIRLMETTRAAPAVLEQSSLSGERLAYGSLRSFADAASAPFTSQYIAERSAGSEWRTHPINSPRGRPIIKALDQLDTEFQAFSPDLCEAWQTTFAEPPLAAGALAGYSNLYRRTDELCSGDGEADYETLAPVAAPENVPPGLSFLMILLGVSADGSHTAFIQGGAGSRQLYLSTATGPRFVCILPDTSAWTGSCTAGSENDSDPGAQVGRISSDGRRIFWSTSGGKLYLRQNPDQPESARLNGAASGKGTLIGPAAGTGNVVKGSELVKNTKPQAGSAFAVGQQISDANGSIPAATTITAIEETSPGVFTLTLSAKPTEATKLGVPLTGAASETVPALITETGAFGVGQQISAPALPLGTTVLSCSPACGPSATSLTLSAKATKTQFEAPLSATSPCTEAATKACTISISEAGEEASGTSKSWFWGAAADGSKAIFSTGELNGSATLYEFDVEGEATTPIAAGVQGVMGISEDAGRVYFASNNVLTGEETNSNGDKAQAGEPNLYLYEAGEGGGAIEFVATVANNDLGGLGFATAGYLLTTARVSPDGLHAAFASIAPLTGYDNKGAASGVATEQIYHYDAAAGELLCASCNPSGARPSGRATIPFWQTSMQAARVLSGDGARLYFNSADALTPRDTNGQIDVYQWEELGTGTCTPASPTYSTQNGGCVDLVSSGQSPLDSRFVEASPSGNDAFFATASGLLPQDPGGVDIYDARVNGGLPIPTGPPPGCEGEACQSPPAAPNDPTPASSAFEGAGNVVEAPPRKSRCPKGNRKVVRKGKSRCVPKSRAAKGSKRSRRANNDRRTAR